MKNNTIALCTLSVLAACAPLACLAQTPPDAPPPPDAPLQASAAWNTGAIAPGATGALGFTFTNPAPMTLPGGQQSVMTSISLPYTDAAGNTYTITTSPVVSLTMAATVPIKHFLGATFPLPLVLSPQPGAGYTFASVADGWQVTLAPFDVLPQAAHGVRVVVTCTGPLAVKPGQPVLQLVLPPLPAASH